MACTIDQNNSAANARMIHAQVAHGMKAAYEKNSVSAAPDFCKQLTAQIQPEHQFGVELLGPKEENACLVMLNESGRLNGTLCVLFILQMGGAILYYGHWSWQIHRRAAASPPCLDSCRSYHTQDDVQSQHIRVTQLHVQFAWFPSASAGTWLCSKAPMFKAPPCDL